MARTQRVGERTQRHTYVAPLTIQNKDPRFDYSFRNRKAIEDGGGEDIYGYEAIREGNNSGEVFSAFPGQKKTRGGREMRYLDAIACRRPKEISAHFKREEDEKYNAQVRHVRSAAKRAREALRNLDPDSVVESKSEFKGPGMSQRPGPTEEGD